MGRMPAECTPARMAGKTGIPASQKDIPDKPKPIADAYPTVLDPRAFA